MDDRFKKAVELVLQHEGGYVNDPQDPGGETNYGISKRNYSRLDIRNMTRDMAVQIYYDDYWKRYGYGMIASDDLAAKVFDMAVNMGAKRAHMILQEAINRTTPWRLAVDGILGPLTIEAINNHPYQELLLAELKLGAIAFYLGLNKPRFIVGWVRRALD